MFQEINAHCLKRKISELAPQCPKETPPKKTNIRPYSRWQTTLILHQRTISQPAPSLQSNPTSPSCAIYKQANFLSFAGGLYSVDIAEFLERGNGEHGDHMQAPNGDEVSVELPCWVDWKLKNEWKLDQWLGREWSKTVQTRAKRRARRRDTELLVQPVALLACTNIFFYIITYPYRLCS